MDDTTLDALAEKLADRLEARFTQTLRATVHEEVSRMLGGQLGDDDFFKRLNQEIMNRLGDIYKELTSVQNGPATDPEHAAQAGELMDEVSQRLDQVIQATEKATFEIIELVERNLHVPDELADYVTKCGAPCVETQDDVNKLCRNLSADLIQIMTCLSFQDLTGQRIKRVIDMLGKVRTMIGELYLSTGILVKAQEKEPQKPLEQLREIAKSKVSQADVDDLLAQLNF